MDDIKQAEFRIKIKEEEIKVTMKMIDAFDYLDMEGAVTDLEGNLRIGSYAKKIIPKICVSPRNLLERLEELQDPAKIMEVVMEVKNFCSNPATYRIRQEQDKKEDSK